MATVQRQLADFQQTSVSLLLFGHAGVAERALLFCSVSDAQKREMAAAMRALDEKHVALEKVCRVQLFGTASSLTPCYA